MEWRLKGMQKVYGKKIALKYFSATLHPGIYALLGPNGAGKSTLMNILAGVLKATRGEVLADNRRLARREYQEHIGYLPQKFGYYEAFTGRDMLYYMRTENKRHGIFSTDDVRMRKDAAEPEVFGFVVSSCVFAGVSCGEGGNARESLSAGTGEI
jgi:ABC-type multidrug transport system ATPase subunit